MAKKKKWMEWAHAWVRSTGNCPGDTPAFGLPEDLMTEEEFIQTMSVSDTHKWVNCHFRVTEDKGDTITAPPEGKKPLIVKDIADIKDVHDMVPHLEEVMDSQRIMTIKKNLHAYVDRIHLKDSGILVIPEPLLDIREYVGKFFDVVK